MPAIVPNIEKPVVVIHADRDQLRRGLLSTGGWSVAMATANVAGLPDTDGALQMLARHRLAYTPAPPRKAGFLDAIHDRTPSGAWIAVQHHPDGDWSVAERPLPWLPGGEVAIPETPEAALQADIDSPAARVEYARMCFTAILETPDDAKALARAGLDLCDLTAWQRAEMRGDA